MKKYFTFLIVLFVLFFTYCDRKPIGNDSGVIDSDNPIDDNYELTWSDEFNDLKLNLAYWSYDIGYGDWGWGNDEWQYYTNNSNNLKLENGDLVIKALLLSNNPGKRDGSITSAKNYYKE